MSQSGSLSDSLTGTGDIETITGDTGGAVSNDSLGNLDLQGSNGISIAGTPASNLLTAEIPEQVTLNAISEPTHSAGQLFYDTDTDALSFHNSESNVTLQIGEENWIKVRNETGSTIVNGRVVYLNGSSSGMPTIALAQANDDTTTQVMGVTTHDIETASEGYVTIFGLVRNVNTSAFSGGDRLFLSATNAGRVTNIKPDNSNHIVRIGYIANAAAAPDGTFLVNIEDNGNIEDIHGYTNNPNGFLDPDDDVSISFDNGTRTFTIQPTGTSFSYWSDGIRYDKSASEDIVISNDEGHHFIYYNGETLTETTTFDRDIITKYAFVAALYWDATNSEQTYLGDEFKHTTKMGPLTHSYLHNTRGFALERGGLLTDITTDQDGSADSHAQFGNEATTAWDEDAEFEFTARTSTSTAYLFYKTGTEAAPTWRLDDDASFPVLTTGTGRAAINELSGGNWVQTEVANNKFLLAHAFTFNDSTRKFGIIQGENQYDTINDAQAGALTEINDIVLDGLGTQEFKFLGTVILQTSNSYTNTVKSRIRSTDDGSDYIDLRGDSIIRGGVFSSSTNTFTDITVNDSLTFDGIDGTFSDSEEVKLQAGVQTTDATVTPIDTITLPDNTMITVEARFNGFIDDYSAAIGGFIQYTARRITGNAIEVSTPIINTQEDSASSPTVDADVSGNDVRLLVQGVASETWNWVVTYRYNFVKTNT